jgi:Cu+-exporting ATPase
MAQPLHLSARIPRKEHDMAIDPVCGMSVEERTAPAKADYQGKSYYFCSAECKEKFQQHPERYVGQPTGAR